jgi:DNA repair protein RecO (recombination protein O)
MTHKTKGIVLRTIKYGETSLVATIFTELFGVQTYMVNGVRTTKQSAAKASYFQPGAILELVVYHHEQKTIQRIKEFKFGFLYLHIFQDVIKNSVALYMMELLYKCLKQPEGHTDLFHFCEDCLEHLDSSEKTIAANFPLFFSLQLSYFFGFKMQDNYSSQNCFLDLREGYFITQHPQHPYVVEGEEAGTIAAFLKVLQPEELVAFKLNGQMRRTLLRYCQDYYSLHIPEFGQLKTMMVLKEVL